MIIFFNHLELTNIAELKTGATAGLVKTESTALTPAIAPLVIAVLGVLSIGGVQGYRYAMNKYTANQLTNELNIINFQRIVMYSLHGFSQR